VSKLFLNAYKTENTRVQKTLEDSIIIHLVELTAALFFAAAFGAALIHIPLELGNLGTRAAQQYS